MSDGQELNYMRYVVTVHGIGEQRKNETLVKVINRFAEVRAQARNADDHSPLTLGMLSGQTSDIHPLTQKPRPWIEFAGIPCSPNSRLPNRFTGKRVSDDNDDGNNIRFVDIHWADVMEGQFTHVGQSVDVWTDALLTRLKNKNPNPCPRWAIELISILRDGVLLAQKILNWKIPSLSAKIFNDFLGDVQLYGEYGPCRGQGVRRFHDLMEAVQIAHEAEQKVRAASGKKTKEARFTILAHSLGSIMSFDALFYACADPTFRGPQRPHFEGYHRANETLNMDWINRVDAFVTLGSPIDKFLTLWWMNYGHLTDTRWIKMPIENREERKIRHFNYTDEQDPVGGELDVAHSAPAVQRLFARDTDLVFTRYPVPGAAHNEYWNDLDLFKDIVHRAADNPGTNQPQVMELKHFLPAAYKKCLWVNYFWVPFIAWLITSFSATLFFYTDSWHTRMTAALAFVFAAYLARKTIRFIIEGRQIAIIKRQDHHPDRQRAAKKLPRIGKGVSGSMIIVGLTTLPFAGQWFTAPDYFTKTYSFAIFIWAAMGAMIIIFGLNTYCRSQQKFSKLLKQEIIDYVKYV